MVVDGGDCAFAVVTWLAARSQARDDASAYCLIIVSGEPRTNDAEQPNSYQHITLSILSHLLRCTHFTSGVGHSRLRWSRPRLAHVRFNSDSDRQPSKRETVAMGQTATYAVQRIADLFDHLVGENEQGGGIARPSALAVLRLMTSSRSVCWKIGRSAGFAPLESAQCMRQLDDTRLLCWFHNS